MMKKLIIVIALGCCLMGCESEKDKARAWSEAERRAESHRHSLEVKRIEREAAEQRRLSQLQWEEDRKQAQVKARSKKELAAVNRKFDNKLKVEMAKIEAKKSVEMAVENRNTLKIKNAHELAMEEWKLKTLEQLFAFLEPYVIPGIIAVACLVGVYFGLRFWAGITHSRHARDTEIEKYQAATKVVLSLPPAERQRYAAQLVDPNTHTSPPNTRLQRPQK